MEDHITQPQPQSEPPMSTTDGRQALQHALLYTYGRLNTNTTQLLETAAALDALIELLCEKGGIAMEELEARQQAAAERLRQPFRQGTVVVTD